LLVRTIHLTKLYQFRKHFESVFTPIGKFKNPNTPVITGLHDPFGDFDIRMIKNGHQRMPQQYFCHFSNLFKISSTVWPVASPNSRSFPKAAEAAKLTTDCAGSCS